MQTQFTDKSIFVEQFSGKGELYDELKATLSKLEHEATTLKSENMFLNVNLKSLAEEKVRKFNFLTLFSELGIFDA